MKDKYPDFETLAKSETEGTDFVVELAARGTKVLVMAPHGGSIEPGTSEISQEIARKELSFYLFKGTKSSKNRDLHITSTKFDEPRALEMLQDCEFVLTIHGEGSDNKVVYLGGLNERLQMCLEKSLNQAGFETDKHNDPDLQGKSAKNICNRGKSKSGVQLEIAKGLRQTFFESLKASDREKAKCDFYRFTAAIREGLARAHVL